MSKVKVAVRVRPLNKRERALGDSEDQVQVLGAKRQVALQEDVFGDLGLPVLEATLQGYNGCIFAYGQTGSGKSFSMMGAPHEPGLIPRLCSGLFERIRSDEAEADSQVKLEVSYMEIYNEKVHDLLGQQQQPQPLKVREHSILGPYVDGLSSLAVASYAQVEKLMLEGNKSRTVAATNMNSESSRSHAVFTLTVGVVTGGGGDSGEQGEERLQQVSSRLSLVDLAGSERAQKTGAVGQRLKEGSNINRSLTTLGLDNLGGNSKTVMVATVSPAGDNLDETLSTLRYAERAKRIVNHAVVNEDPGARMVRELRDQVDALRRQLADQQRQSSLPAAVVEAESSSSAGGVATQAKLAESERLMRQLSRSWEEKLRQTEQTDRSFFLVNLNADPALNEMLVYYLRSDRPETRVGRPPAQEDEGGDGQEEEEADIQLQGLGIARHHCLLRELQGDEGEGLELVPVPGARSLVNGQPVTEARRLQHGDRILWGHHHFFKLSCPKPGYRERRLLQEEEDRLRLQQEQQPEPEEQEEQEEEKIDFEYAQTEVLQQQLSVRETETVAATGDDEEGRKERQGEAQLDQVVKALQEQHQQEKRRALDDQRAKYEKQLHLLRSSVALAPPLASSGPGGPLEDTEYEERRRMRQLQEERAAFGRSVRQLRQDMVKADALCSEANAIAKELRLGSRFKVTLQIPAANLACHGGGGHGSSFVSEPAILVTSGSGSGNNGGLQQAQQQQQLWTMDKLDNKLADARELLIRRQHSQKEPLSNQQEEEPEGAEPVEDPFHESQQNHILIGVANVFLDALFYEGVRLDHWVPVVSQQGSVQGRLQVTLSRSAGAMSLQDRMAGGSSSSDDNEDDDETERPKRRSNSGRTRQLANYVFCQYSLFGLEPVVVAPTEVVSSSGGKKQRDLVAFDHEQEFTFQVTDELVEYCAEGGALAIEVWGHRHSPASDQDGGGGGSGPQRHLVGDDGQLVKCLGDRWSELKRRLQLWLQIQELSDEGTYVPVEVRRGDSSSGCAYGQATGGIYQLRQGQQRRLVVSVNQTQVGSLPLLLDGVREVAVGGVTLRDSRSQRPLDSYQESELTRLRDKWQAALQRRKQHLDSQIQAIADRQQQQQPQQNGAKSEEEREREQQLIDQWVQLTEERNAVKCPAPGSAIPGAPLLAAAELSSSSSSRWSRTCPWCSWTWTATVCEGTAPLQPLDQSAEPPPPPLIGAAALLAKEGRGCPFTVLPLLPPSCGHHDDTTDGEEQRVVATAAWDSSLHDSVALNRVTGATERVQAVLRVVVRLSCSGGPRGPGAPEALHRQRLQAPEPGGAPPASLRRLLGATGVTVELVAQIPSESQDIEDRASLAMAAARQLLLRSQSSSGAGAGRRRRRRGGHVRGGVRAERLQRAVHPAAGPPAAAAGRARARPAGPPTAAHCLASRSRPGGGHAQDGLGAQLPATAAAAESQAAAPP
ncbi:Kinesin-like protein KIF13A [Halotydeus destructor]|nr:Kinesin-like protein KIF13A [Halotydeus destructor]